MQDNISEGLLQHSSVVIAPGHKDSKELGDSRKIFRHRMTDTCSTQHQVKVSPYHH